MLANHHPTSYHKYSQAGWQFTQGNVVSEMAVSMSVNGETWLSFLCTPGYLEALAAGFLFNEQIIQSHSEIAALHVCQAGDHIDVWLHKAVQKPAQWLRTSGCGGGYTVAKTPLLRQIPTSTPPIAPEALLERLEEMLTAQELYHEAHGVHTSALSDEQRIFYQVEDIGRHNTLDKLAGRLLLEPVDPSPRIVLTTGRISSEMMNKAIRLGAEVVLSRTSPTTHSIQLARAAGITLIGYARRGQLLVYAHPELLLGAPTEALPGEIPPAY